jgi:hypothetical protein
MLHSIHRVRGFDIVGPYTLTIRFDDGTSRTIDFRPVLEGEVFAPLQELGFFNQVALDREAHTLVWPNGADFDPETLHNWPEYEEELVDMASRWAGRSNGGRDANR